MVLLPIINLLTVRSWWDLHNCTSAPEIVMCRVLTASQRGWAVRTTTVTFVISPDPLLAVVLGLSLTGAVTQFTKVTVGRPRPGLWRFRLSLGVYLGYHRRHFPLSAYTRLC